MPATKTSNLKTHNVGSHLGLIEFVPGATVPIGFLASHRKANHLDCLSGKGFQTCTSPTGAKAHVLCHCASERATKKLKQVGGAAFIQLGNAWLAEARAAVKADEERCRLEGLRAAEGDINPYQKDSDQHIAWQDGFNAD